MLCLISGGHAETYNLLSRSTIGYVCAFLSPFSMSMSMSIEWARVTHLGMHVFGGMEKSAKMSENNGKE